MADDDVIVPVTIPAWEAERLSALVSEEQGLPDLEAVIYTVIDHLQQGIRRGGSWERELVTRLFGEGFLARMETDPDSPYFDRVRRDSGG